MAALTAALPRGVPFAMMKTFQEGVEVPIIRDLLVTLPDIPKWVEVRSILLRGECEIYGLEHAPISGCVLRDSRLNLMAVVGRPSTAAIREAAAKSAGRGELLSESDTEVRRHVAAALPEWKDETAILHLPGDSMNLPEVREGMVRILERSEIETLSEVPEELRNELQSASGFTDVAGAIENGRPVSFCYAGAVTESLWDIAIDTLEPYRRHGHAARCVTYMIHRMSARGKQPVWGALESNDASLGLAARLGFEPVDRLAVFTSMRG